MIRNINNNKVLMISHIADIDGMGSVILAKKFYGNIDYILCEVLDLIDLFKEDFSNYEKIFVCDLPICEDAIKVLDDREDITSKLLHFDHHVSSLTDNMPSYINCHDDINGRRTCGTELFFKYLMKQVDCNVSNIFYATMVEAIRENDTWDFTDRHNLGNYLASIHAMLGAEPFLEFISTLDDSKEFEIPKVFMDLIKADEEKMISYINTANKRLYITNYKEYKIGVSIGEQYRSILGDEICKLNPEIDFILIINFGRMTCSLRTIRDDIDLSQICLDFHHNGGGHRKAAGFVIDDETIPKITDYVVGYINNKKEN